MVQINNNFVNFPQKISNETKSKYLKKKGVGNFFSKLLTNSFMGQTFKSFTFPILN